MSLLSYLRRLITPAELSPELDACESCRVTSCTHAQADVCETRLIALGHAPVVLTPPPAPLSPIESFNASHCWMVADSSGIPTSIWAGAEFPISILPAGWSVSMSTWGEALAAVRGAGGLR